VHDLVSRRQFARITGLGVAGLLAYRSAPAAQEDPLLKLIEAQISGPLDPSCRQVAATWLANREKIYGLRKSLTLDDCSEPCTVYRPTGFNR
jgi:hypothetical protein